MNPLDPTTTKLHEEWLKHPVTQDVIKILKSRHDYYKKSLQEGILSYSNKEAEDKLRSAMTTTEALGLLLFETPKFVQQLNNINKK
jgi:hypothetical protein